MNKQYFKCDICGKYISNMDLIRGMVKVDHNPETLISCEKIYHTHKNCIIINERR